MGLRSRVKGRLKRMLGGEAATPAPAPPRTAPPRPKPPAPAPAPASAPTPEEAAQQEKIEKHMRRTRKGVLQLLIDSGGQSTLAEMHDHSERRYFVGHKKFSDLMEAMIADAHIDYDASVGEAAITEAGRTWVEEQG